MHFQSIDRQVPAIHHVIKNSNKFTALPDPTHIHFLKYLSNLFRGTKVDVYKEHDAFCSIGENLACLLIVLLWHQQ